MFFTADRDLFHSGQSRVYGRGAEPGSGFNECQVFPEPDEGVLEVRVGDRETIFGRRLFRKKFGLKFKKLQSLAKRNLLPMWWPVMEEQLVPMYSW